MRRTLRRIASMLAPADRTRLDECLKCVAVEPKFFELMPFSVVIYNATGSPKEAILLEPMAAQIGEGGFDNRAAKVHVNAREPHEPSRPPRVTSRATTRRARGRRSAAARPAGCGGPRA